MFTQRLHTAPAVERVLDALARNSFYFIMFLCARARPLLHSVARLCRTRHTLTRNCALHQIENFFRIFIIIFIL